MSELLKISLGNTGLNGFPKEISLVELQIDNEQDLIKIRYKEYTVIAGVKIEPVYFKYVLRDLDPHKNRFGEIIQDKDPESGEPLWEVVSRQVIINGVPQQINGTLDPLMEDVTLPKPLLGQFTKWVNGFKSILWDGVIEDGIKDHYKLEE